MELRVPSREVMEDFYVEHEARAVRIAGKMLRGDVSGARDVVHEAFLRAFLKLHTFRGKSSQATWFSRIVINESVRYLERSRRVEDAFDGIDDLAGPELPMQDPMLRKRILEAIEELSGPQRDIFMAVHMSDYTVKETAHLVGKATGTVRTHLQRALIHLREALGDAASETLAELSRYVGDFDPDSSTSGQASTWV